MASAFVLLLGAGVQARPQSGQLTQSRLLAHMDDAARNLRTVSTKLAYTTVTVLVNDRSTQYGELYYRKQRRGLEVLVHFFRPEPKQILFKGSKAEIYYPRTNQIQEYNLAHRTDLLQQFLLLGFGTEIGRLKASYNIQYLGEQELGSSKLPALQLTPTNPDVLRQLAHVELWVSPETWLPVQQKFFEPGGDYLIAHYSDMKINQDLGSSVFKIKASPGAERLKMN